MAKIININRNILYSYVQGRLSAQMGSKYQYFPISDWQKELIIANKLGFKGIEWLISDLSNPLFNLEFIKLIKNKLKKNKLKISSISLDLIMDNPLHKMNKQDALWLINRINNANKYLKIKRISIPIEERSRFNNAKEKKKAFSILQLFCKRICKNINLCIETDISPDALKKLFNKSSFKRLGLLLDLGNTRAHGFRIEDYFINFSTKIYSIHIKYRGYNYGKSKVIPKKGFYELSYLIKNIDKLKNLNDISFQTFKSKNYYLKNLKNCVINFNKYAK